MVCLRRASRLHRVAAVLCGQLCWCTLLVPTAESHASALNQADLAPGRLQPDAGDLALSAAGEQQAAALAHYSSALRFEELGRMRDALKHYREALKLDPANAELAARTAEIAMSFSGRDEALRILRDSMVANPSSSRPYLNLAAFLSTYASDDPFEADSAARAIEEALRKFPGDAEVYKAGVMFYLAHPQASDLSIASDADAGKASAAGRSASVSGRDAAARVLERALKQPVTDPAFWLSVGRVAQEMWPLGQQELKDQHRARVNPFFENALRHASGAIAEETSLQVAQYYVLTNQLAPATAICEKLAAGHRSVRARKMLFRLYEAAGKHDLAFSTLQQIVKDNPKDVEQRKLLANAFEQREDLAQAVSHLEAAIQFGGGDIGDYNRLTELMIRSRLYEKAVQFAQRGIRLFPDQISFRVFAGIGYRMLRQWEQAIKQFAEADSLAQASTPDQLNYRFYFQYGVTLERAGRFDEAAGQFEKSITLTPKDEDSIKEAANTMNYLGYMWLERNQHLDKAGELIRKANEIEQNNPAFIDSLGWFHFKKGDYNAALRELRRAEGLLKEPQAEDAEIIDHIGQAYEKLGDKPKAIEYLKKAGALDPENEAIKKRLEELLGKRQPPPVPKTEEPEKKAAPPLNKV